MIAIVKHALSQASEFAFEMVHGVVRVWADASRERLIADAPGDSYEFFVDMHRRACMQLERIHMYTTCFLVAGMDLRLWQQR